MAEEREQRGDNEEIEVGRCGSLEGEGEGKNRRPPVEPSGLWSL